MKELIDLNETDMNFFGDLEEHIKKIPITKNFRKALTFFTSYPEDSLLSDNTRAFLYQLIRAMIPDKVLEIGCHLAGTSEVLARALWANNKGHLITIDPFAKEMGTQERINQWPDELQRRVTLHPINSASYFTISEDIVNPEEHGFFSNFNLIFIDGNHDYAFVLFDLMMSAKHCAPEGVIVLDNADLPGVLWALKNFIALNNEWTILENPMQKHIGKNPFETIYASFENQFILLRSQYIAVNQIPVSFKSNKFYEPGIKGYEFEFLPDHCEGTLHALIFFRSFYNQPNLGCPEERKITTSIHLKDNQDKVILQIDPLISYESREKSHRKSEILLLWQPAKVNQPLFLKKNPEPILIKNYSSSGNTSSLRSGYLSGRDISFLRFSHLEMLDLKMYEYGINSFTEPKFKQELTTLLNQLKKTEAADLIKKLIELDEFYEKAIYCSDLPAVKNAYIDLYGMFIGTGWGPAEMDIHGTKWRWLGPEGISNLYLRLEKDCSYFIKTLIFAAKGNSQDRFNVYVNTDLAQHQRIMTEADQQVFHNCIIPKESLNQNKGWVKISYKVENPVEDLYPIANNTFLKPAEVALILVQCDRL